MAILSVLYHHLLLWLGPDGPLFSFFFFYKGKITLFSKVAICVRHDAIDDANM